jgi:hypothetical protein|tara:strand:- start:162 stop:326 length:165 start_codon:yes stop_codon:yes gene_type:complete
MNERIKNIGKELNKSYLDAIDWTHKQYCARPMPIIGIGVAIFTIAVIVLWEVIV